MNAAGLRSDAGARKGTCMCDAGYAGEHCESYLLRTPTCLHNCSGRGTCQLHTGRCACMPGYTGDGCELLDDSTRGSCPKVCHSRSRPS